MSHYAVQKLRNQTAQLILWAATDRFRQCVRPLISVRVANETAIYSYGMELRLATYEKLATVVTFQAPKLNFFLEWTSQRGQFLFAALVSNDACNSLSFNQTT